MTKEKFIESLRPVGNINNSIFYLNFGIKITDGEIESQVSIEALKRFILKKIELTLDNVSKEEAISS